MKKFYGINEELILTDSVAVVGSGPSLLKLNEGKDIDSFDTVIRFNGAIVNGYEEKVGSKTDLLCVGLDLGYFFNYPFVAPNGDITRKDSKNRYQNALILATLFPTAQILTWACEPARAEKNKQHQNFEFLEAALIHNKRSPFSWATEKSKQELQHNYQGNRVLVDYGIDDLLASGRGMRTGFRTVLMLVKSGIKPTLFGFDVDPDIRNAKHYYDNFISDSFEDHPAHDFKGEMAALVELRNRNLIKIVG